MLLFLQFDMDNLLIRVSGSHQEGQCDSWEILYQNKDLCSFGVRPLVLPLICTASIIFSFLLHLFLKINFNFNFQVQKE